jgi:tetratricopeptide (TPR) repeat protein
VHVVVDLARVLETPLEGAELLDEAADRAEREGNEVGAAFARAAAAFSRSWTVKNGDNELERLALEALPLLETAGDHAGLAEVWAALAGGVYNGRCQYAQIEHASEQANRHALLAGQPPRLGMIGPALVYGPRPVSDALPMIEARAETYRHPGTRLDLAVFLAMSDRIDEARALAEAAQDQLREFGGERIADEHMTDIERIAGNTQAEADHLRANCDDLRVRGVTAALSTYASMLGRALCTLGEFDDVEELAAEGREYGAEADPVTQALWRQVTALVHAHRGNHADAERFAREAVAYSQQTDSPWTQGDALWDLATVLEAGGRLDDALAALREALGLYEQKEIVPVARRTRERLAALQAPTA